MTIDKIRTTAYKPSTNGNIERFHGTLNAILAKWVSSHQRDWADKLAAVAFAYRTSIHETTGFSPYYLLYGREARAPADLVYGFVSEEANQTHCEAVDKQLQVMRDAYNLVRQNLGKAASRRKKHYDMRVRPQTFKTGTWVWYFIPRRRQGRCPKWESFGQGPYLVIRELGTSNVVIQSSPRAKPIIVHTDKLKQCFTEGLTSWLPGTVTTDVPCEPTTPSPPVQVDSDASSDSSVHSETYNRPRRNTRIPARFR